MPDYNREYELLHLRNLKADQEAVRQAYLDTIEEIFRAVAVAGISTTTFRLSDYPTLRSQIESLMRAFRDRIYAIVTRGISREFYLSDRKNGAVIGDKLGEGARRLLQPTSPEVVQDFITKPTRRLTLSNRVWKLNDQFYAEIEQTLFTGIEKGQSARTMATQMKQYLRQPDRLYRRVRDAKGKLVLSQQAKRYKPGAGIYRSSFKNALRMTRTEVNTAYRTADGERWKSSPFVLGYEIKLSLRHPKIDICDSLKGVYPVSFEWKHWHPQCLCYKIPILPTPEEYDKYEQAILNGTDKSFKFSNRIKDVPAKFKAYVSNNRETMEGWKRLPVWMTENRRFVKPILQD